jgi:hypothetical protein
MPWIFVKAKAKPKKRTVQGKTLKKFLVSYPAATASDEARVKVLATSERDAIKKAKDIVRSAATKRGVRLSPNTYRYFRIIN